MKTWNKEIWESLENFWLPRGSSWQELHEYTQLDLKQTLLQCFILALIIYRIRLFFEQYIGTPIGKYLGIPDKLKFTPNPVLETYYGKDKVINESILMLIAKDTGTKFEEVKYWFEARKSLNKTSKLTKFNESSWRFIFYSFIWFYGCYVVHDKVWFKEINNCWVNYPRQYVTDDVYIYYLIEMSFYFSLLVSQFTDVKRKDFLVMFLHHIVTLSLLIFSLLCNFHRIGCLILLLHDTADSSVELAKMGSYAKIKWLSDPFFALFVLIWFVTRLYIYPTRILNSTLFDAPKYLNEFPAYYCFNALLCILQILHVIWFGMMLVTIYRILTFGTRDDNRSMSDESSHQHND